MPANERMQALRIKKRKTKVTPLSADELRVPPAAVDPPIIIPVEIHVFEDELENPTESPLLSRKRKQPSEDQPPPPPEPSMPFSARSSPSAFGREAASSPTIWPEFNANFLFQLFESFVRETDDHRFGNSSIRDLIEEGKSYQAKANAVFGRLLPRYKESEAEEDAARREKATLASALERERRAHGTTLFNNECLQKDVNNLKEKLETAEATHQLTVTTNIDLVRWNEVLVGKNETMVKTNKSLAVQVHDLEARDLRHLKERAKLEEELRELRALRDLGPPLTGDLRREVQQEYRKSAELNEEIVQMFSDGYDECRSKDKARLVAAEVDPTILDSSEDEADP